MYEFSTVLLWLTLLCQQNINFYTNKIILFFFSLMSVLASGLMLWSSASCFVHYLFIKDVTWKESCHGDAAVKIYISTFLSFCLFFCQLFLILQSLYFPSLYICFLIRCQGAGYHFFPHTLDFVLFRYSVSNNKCALQIYLPWLKLSKYKTTANLLSVIAFAVLIIPWKSHFFQEVS